MKKIQISFSREVAETLGLESAIILELFNQNLLDNSSYDGSESEVTQDDYYARSRGVFFGFLFSIVLIFLLIIVSTQSYFYFEFIRNLV